MAESVVSIVLESIRNLLVQESNFYFGVRLQVEDIKRELQQMRCFLKDADSKQDTDDRVLNCVAEIREAAYDIEDNLLIFAAAKLSSRNSIMSLNKISSFCNEIVITYKVGSRIADIRTKLVGLTNSLQIYGIKPINNTEELPDSNKARSLDLRRSYSHVVEEDFLGLHEDIKLLVPHLIDEHKYPAIFIHGMGGLGKTTIARKLYHHRDVRRHFDGFAWTCVSQQWDKMDILQGILIKLIPEKRVEILVMRDEELVKQLHDVQLTKKCLVVLDDIWSIQAWETFKPAFPNTGCGSKVILTSRNQEVAFYVVPNGFLYKPRFLTFDESWELLRKKAFPRRETGHEFKMDSDMEKLGKEMVVRCCGLPLAILVLGGLLLTKHTLRDWQMVYDNINWYLAKGRGPGQKHAVTEVLSFSYDELPYQFKQCFLYLANFPEDFEIEAEKLYQFWLAEGIISHEDKAEEETMMDVAERSLAELAQRCMVQVNVKETAGGFKNCRLHDLMRDLCITKAKKENFTKVLDYRREIKVEESYSSTSTTRRVSVYLDPEGTQYPVSLVENRHHIRSAFLYAHGCNNKYLQFVKSKLGSFELLRVLNIQGFNNGHELPKAIGGLIHLRYLGLSSSRFKKLPSSLGKLKYLETLDLEVDTLLDIPNVLWKMEALKHLYLPGNFCTQDGMKLRLNGLGFLETLVNFNTSLCDVNDLEKLTNLRKLRAVIKDKLEDLPNIIKYISFTQNHLRRSSLSISCPEFCSDADLSLLRTLLGCHRLYKVSIHGRIGKFPEHYHFSSSIAKIAFKGSVLDQDPMRTLEKLPKLSSLTLYDSAYVGEEMTCLEMGFPRLLYLKVWGLSNLKRWRIEEGAMPKLNRLVIANCDKLEMVPDGLRFITMLQKLNVRYMPHDFRNRLRLVDGNEGEDYYKVRHVTDVKLD